MPQYFVIRYGGFACTGIHDCHFKAVDGVTTYVGEYGAFRFFGATLHNCQVYFPGVALCKLCGQGEVGIVIFGHNNAATGIFIQPVHNPGAFYSAYAG